MNRNEAAISETKLKYERYCFSIAERILHNTQDTEECVNDTYLGAWNAIPPNKPSVLSTFLGKITRRLSLKKLRSMKAQKRGAGETAVALDELEDCVPSGQSIDETLESHELTRLIDEFLGSIPEDDRKVFVCRYWYLDPIKDISERFGFSQSKVKMTLKRTREKLRLFLQKEDIFI